ncbi:potassium uptake protein KtrA [Spiroplasma chinense]|uniref:Potassium uptake protein KtrA n=1 Tax=Spiroplasma chinense TaxID=216932 RepID=A0A5B9Y3Y4_9MOLU|nr:TrkA family potassium uptake protein [Spiroplasma chinense]QEH61376.1 potassium uptake protein KtrA [Spiroplasma chinense]
MAKKKSFAIIGASNFGLSVAKTLDEKRQNIKIFDINEEKLNLHLSDFEAGEAIVLDSTNKNALEKNGIAQFDCVIVAFGSDMEASILTVLNLIDLEVENIIVSARDKHHKRILLALGIEEDKIIIPDVLAGRLIATKSLFDIDGDVQSTDGEYSFTHIMVKNEEVFDKTINEAGLSTNKDFNIVQIKRNGKVVIPDEYTVLKEDDFIVMFAKNNMVNDLILKIRGEMEEE